MRYQTCIILAGGKSQRFPSPLGKMRYPFIRRPLLDYTIEQAKALFQKIIVVIAPSLEPWFCSQYQSFSQITYVIQPTSLGTWDALRCAINNITTSSCVVLNGDMPLVSRAILERVSNSQALMALVTAEHPFPVGYGRIVRSHEGTVLGIVEDKDLSPDRRAVSEINAGIYFFEVSLLKKLTIEKALSCQEWYLTNLWKESSPFLSQTEFIFESDYRIVQGINTWMDYELAEQFYYQIQREFLVRQGALLQHCKDIYIEGTINVQPFVSITGPCLLQGHLSLAPEVQIHPYSFIENVSMGIKSQIGPFAKVGENSSLEANSHLGSFIEVKRSHIGAGSKAKHFSYLADTTVGSHSNIGAFVVTCNYDGKQKHRTQIGHHVFIGCSTQLVAPIVLSDHCYIGAGTTLTHSVASYSLVTRRAPIKSRAQSQNGEPLLCAELSQD